MDPGCENPSTPTKTATPTVTPDRLDLQPAFQVIPTPTPTPPPS